jgi:hypothetical protein
MPSALGGDERRDPVGEQVVLRRAALGVVGAPGVGRRLDAASAQERRELLGRRDGQAVDDAAARQVAQVVGEPGPAVGGAGQRQHGEVQRLPVEPAAQDERLAAAGRQLLGDVGHDPAVGRGGRREHRGAGRQVAEQRADASVVGPEVVPPVGDAVGLVDDEQPGGRRQPGQHRVAEPRVVEPLGADEQDVDLAARHGRRTPAASRRRC